MRKSIAIAALAAAVAALIYSDITVRRGADGWCAWWRSNVKVCSVDVDRATDRGGAVCSTDLDCAAWEVLTDTPHADRVYGAPVPVRAGR